MINDRELIADVEKAAPDKFANILKTASGATERVLRTHFGDAAFERMLTLAQRAAPAPTSSVIMLPGILGSELHEGDETIWIDVWSIIKGDFDQLQVNMDGSSVKAIQAPNMLKKYYGEMQLALRQQWNVIAFPFDWRLDIRGSAQRLKAKIDESLQPGDRLRFAAHSMGGLVVRSFLQQFPDQWDRVDRFIMMGTPNYGSFAIPVLYNGLNQVLKLVALLDQTYDMPQLLQFAKMFVGTYEMQPFLGKSPDAQRLFDPAVYSDLNPPQQRFENAKAFQGEIAGAIRTDKMCYIAGYNQETPNGIADWNKLQSSSGYTQTLAGDGTVPHSLGLIDGVKNYFVEAEHSSLPADGRVIQAVQEILNTGSTTVLPNQMPPIPPKTQELMLAENTVERGLQEARAHLLAGIVRLEKPVHPDKVGRSESELRDLVFAAISKGVGA